MFQGDCVRSFSLAPASISGGLRQGPAGSLVKRLAAFVDEETVMLVGASAGLVVSGGIVLKALAQAF